MDNRRISPTLEPLRTWITSLRTTGGDFDKRAAIAAGRAAAEARRNGYSVEEAFEIGRCTYYNLICSPAR